MGRKEREGDSQLAKLLQATHGAACAEHAWLVRRGCDCCLKALAAGASSNESAALPSLGPVVCCNIVKSAWDVGRQLEGDGPLIVPRIDDASTPDGQLVLR